MNPVVGLLQRDASCLIDARLDLAWVSLCQVVEAAIRAFPVLGLGWHMSDLELLRGGREFRHNLQRS